MKITLQWKGQSWQTRRASKELRREVVLSASWGMSNEDFDKLLSLYRDFDKILSLYLDANTITTGSGNQVNGWENAKNRYYWHSYASSQCLTKLLGRIVNVFQHIFTVPSEDYPCSPWNRIIYFLKSSEHNKIKRAVIFLQKLDKQQDETFDDRNPALALLDRNPDPAQKRCCQNNWSLVY